MVLKHRKVPTDMVSGFLLGERYVSYLCGIQQKENDKRGDEKSFARNGDVC